MLCYRLTRHADLSGEGGRLYAGRWHNAGAPIVYAAGSDALCILEVRVNLDLGFDFLPPDYVLQTIEVNDRFAVEEARLEPDDPEAQAYGDAWLTESTAGTRPPILRVRSIVARRSFNFLLNPRVPDFGAVTKTIGKEPFRFDPRLWRVG